MMPTAPMMGGMRPMMPGMMPMMPGMMPGMMPMMPGMMGMPGMMPNAPSEPHSMRAQTHTQLECTAADSLTEPETRTVPASRVSKCQGCSRLM